MRKITRSLKTLPGLSLAVLAVAIVPAWGQNNPVPLINQPLVPASVVPGASGFTLTVNGTGFVSSSVVNWDGSPLVTTFVSGSQLTAAVSSPMNVVTAGTASVSVFSGAPGGGTSNVIYFSMTNPTSFITLSQSQLSPSQGPDAIAVADFNNDGKPDLVVGNADADTISIFLGKGDGTFQPRADYGTGFFPVGVAVGDFNGDGKLDVATANEGDGTISILLGNGNGTFGPYTDYATGGLCYTVAVGDFNRDGKADLAATELYGDAVSVLLGNGDGSFRNYVNYATGANADFVVIGDFNRDGELDLAASNSGNGFGTTISVLFGNGDGTFQKQVTYDTGTEPSGMVTGDFNGDGMLDIAVANAESNTISILLGIGNGTFQLQKSYATSTTPNRVAVGELNGDGILDLATTDTNGDANSILLGNGNGTFQAHVDFPFGVRTFGVALGDFNQDGRLDLASTSFDSSEIFVSLQDPAVTLSRTKVNFGTQKVGTSSAPQEIRLTNTGSAPLTLTGMRLTGAHADDSVQSNTCGSVLAGGASCGAEVVFTPKARGSRTADFSITDDAAGSPQQVSLVGVGT